MAIELFIDQENHMLKAFSPKSGSKVVVHDPSVSPMADEFGIDLKPNSDSSIAIQLVSLYQFILRYSS